MATFFKFNQFVEDVASGVHQMQTGTAHSFKVYLTNTAPDAAADAVKADLAEISGGNGYTSGGASAGTVTGAETSGTFKLTLGTDPSWTASGGTIGPFRYAVLYNDTPTSPADPLIGAWDYGSSITLAIGESFTVDLDGSNGVLTIA
jgi:hypothetical protein